MSAICAVPSLRAENEASMELLRLFTSKTERKQLDQARERFLSGFDSGEVQEENINSENLRQIKYDGVVMRKDGKHKIWINGFDVPLGPESRFQAQLLADRSVRLKVNAEQTIRLSPGQVYRFEDGLIQEAYQMAKAYVEPVFEEEVEEPSEEAASEDEAQKQAVEFDEAELAEQISRIRLLEDRIEELEKQRNDAGAPLP